LSSSEKKKGFLLADIWRKMLFWAEKTSPENPGVRIEA
jgi:hypothetical protein